MSDERRKVLEMLAEGKVNPDEAERLLDALEPSVPQVAGGPSAWPEGFPKNLYVRVDPKEGAKSSDQVKVTVPLALVKAGINFLSLLPKVARDEVEGAMSEQGFDFNLDSLNDAKWEALLVALQELEVDVETNEHTVKVWTE